MQRIGLRYELDMYSEQKEEKGSRSSIDRLYTPIDEYGARLISRADRLAASCHCWPRRAACVWGPSLGKI
jgi:hypothetical protein